MEIGSIQNTTRYSVCIRSHGVDGRDVSDMLADLDTQSALRPVHKTVWGLWQKVIG